MIKLTAFLSDCIIRLVSFHIDDFGCRRRWPWYHFLFLIFLHKQLQLALLFLLFSNLLLFMRLTPLFFDCGPFLGQLGKLLLQFLNLVEHGHILRRKLCSSIIINELFSSLKLLFPRLCIFLQWIDFLLLGFDLIVKHSEFRVLLRFFLLRHQLSYLLAQAFLCNFCLGQVGLNFLQAQKSDRVVNFGHFCLWA